MIPEPKAKELVQKIHNDKPAKRFYKNFVKFLVNFNVIGYTSAFLIAMCITNLLGNMHDLMFAYFKKYDKTGILVNFIILIMATIAIYLFVEYVFYKYMYTKEVSNERKLEKVIDDNDTKKIKKNTKNNNLSSLNKTAIKLQNDEK
tara:strand:+ start:363 stop:800 length:438 start_codon:yes stop_codon:yes gene_type:complete